ncbi:MAG: sugar-binding domain-containing protein, partial [Asticcacaulis sp.]
MTRSTEMARRDLLACGLAFGAAGLASGGQAAESAQALSNGADPFPLDDSALAPRERLLFDFGWKFTFGHGSDPAKDLGFGFGQADFSKTGLFAFARTGYDDSHWRSLNLPHDWAVELPFVHDDAGTGDNQLRSHGYKPLGRRYPETSVGWYRREFDIPASDKGRRIWVEFDGAMRDTLVFVNGCFIGRNGNGYTPFRFDLTDFLVCGGKNVITVRADASFGDGWFYEGAGLYRHVWLLKTSPVYLERWETTVRPVLDGGAARIELSSVVANMDTLERHASLSWTLIDPRGKAVATARTPAQTVAPGRTAPCQAVVSFANPQVWSLESPALYTAQVNVEHDG